MRASHMLPGNYYVFLDFIFRHVFWKLGGFWVCYVTAFKFLKDLNSSFQVS